MSERESSVEHEDLHAWQDERFLTRILMLGKTEMKIFMRTKIFMLGKTKMRILMRILILDKNKMGFLMLGKTEMKIFMLGRTKMRILILDQNKMGFLMLGKTEMKILMLGKTEMRILMHSKNKMGILMLVNMKAKVLHGWQDRNVKTGKVVAVVTNPETVAFSSPPSEAYYKGKVRFASSADAVLVIIARCD